MIRKYLTMTRAGILEMLQFRIGLLLMFIGNLFFLGISYFLWKAIYASASSPCINGMTFYDTMVYLVLASSITTFLEDYIVWDVGSDIETGKITLDLIRPISYRKFVFLTHIGNNIGIFFITFVPTFFIVNIVTNWMIPMGLNLVAFLLSAGFSIVIYYLIEFFVSTICIHTLSIWGINIMKQVIVQFFSGAVIPFAFFPGPLKRIAMSLPFQAIYNTPLTILTSSTISPMEVVKMLGIQVFWIFILLIVTDLFFKHSVKKITINGG